MFFINKEESRKSIDPLLFFPSLSLSLCVSNDSQKHRAPTFSNFLKNLFFQKVLSFFFGPFFLCSRISRIWWFRLSLVCSSITELWHNFFMVSSRCLFEIYLVWLVGKFGKEFFPGVGICIVFDSTSTSEEMRLWKI